jgi:predicted 3-demethylubiquinone-9 3-methyltransferase (glyoxalase superfamily)
MTGNITTFLMFEGRAEEAMGFYVSLFPDSRIVDVSRYGAEGPGPKGTVMRADFILRGRPFMCIDSPVKHAFSFTPSMSLFVDCENEAEIDRLFASLSEQGKVMMPLDAYPFARKFAWISDRFGVSWQLSLSS